LLLIGAGMLAVFIWGRQEWTPAFPSQPFTGIPGFNRSRLPYLVGVGSALLIALAAGFRYLAAPNETFGLAGIPWLVGIGLLLWSASLESQAIDHANDSHLTRWTT
jgi:hypothetical protein